MENLVLENVMVLYSHTDRPSKEKGKFKPTYDVTVVVDEDTADSFSETYDRHKVASIATSAFKEKFGLEPPFPEQKKQYMVSIKRKAVDKEGNAIPVKKRPRVYRRVGADTIEDVTQKFWLQRGSSVSVEYLKYEYDGETFHMLLNILGSEFQEIKRGSGSAFGKVVSNSTDDPEDMDNDGPNFDAQSDSSDDDMEF